jgi:hypothetical protein
MIQACTRVISRAYLGVNDPNRIKQITTYLYGDARTHEVGAVVNALQSLHEPDPNVGEEEKRRRRYNLIEIIRINSTHLLNTDLSGADLESPSPTNLNGAAPSPATAPAVASATPAPSPATAPAVASATPAPSPVNLVQANFEGAYLEKTHFSGTDLRGANLRGAHLSEADLSGANLSGADLRGAKLQPDPHLLRGPADLRGADLRGTDFRATDLRGAKLLGAKVEGANLDGAQVSSIDEFRRSVTGHYQGTLREVAQ